MVLLLDNSEQTTKLFKGWRYLIQVLRLDAEFRSRVCSKKGFFVRGSGNSEEGKKECDILAKKILCCFEVSEATTSIQRSRVCTLQRNL